MDLAVALAARNHGPVIGGCHRLRHGQARERRSAELAGIAVAIGIERPTPLPGIDCARQLGRIRNRILDLRDDGIGMTVGERNPGLSQPCHRRLEGAPSLWRGNLPARGLEHGERARALRRRRFGRPLQPRVTWIPTGPRGNIYRDKPSVFERGGEHAGTALAEIIVAAAAIDPADARLETDNAAKTGRTQDRADDLGPERRRDHAAGHRGGGAATRSARRARAIPRVPSAPRLSGRKLRRHHFAEDHRPGLAQRSDAGRIAAGAPPRQ